MPSAAVFSSDLVKEHSSYSAGGLATCQMDNSCRTCKMPVKEHTASYGGFESCGSGKFRQMQEKDIPALRLIARGNKQPL